MDLHLKHRNGIVVEIAERNFHGNKKAISLRSSPADIRGGGEERELSRFLSNPSFFFFYLSREKEKIRTSRDAEFDSHLIVPRLIRDRGFHCWHNETTSANLSR